jgi:hypothetical protein
VGVASNERGVVELLPIVVPFVVLVAAGAVTVVAPSPAVEGTVEGMVSVSGTRSYPG